MKEAHHDCVLAIGAHPDDVEIFCAGTLKQLRDCGLEVHVATMTLGDCGSHELSPKDIERVRRKEAESACALLGATYHYVGSSDFCIFNDDEQNRRVTALIRDVGPVMVLTHPPADYLMDHETTSTLVRNACFCAPVVNYETNTCTESGPLPHIPHLYYFDPMEGKDIFGKPVAPEFYVDITQVIDFRLKMLARHASQREWLLAQHGMDDYLNSSKVWAEARGRDATAVSGRKVAYAEGFRQHHGHAYPQNNVMKEILVESVVCNPAY
jgi:LmbE family N-acetylglucosaminyl deacetylase